MFLQPGVALFATRAPSTRNVQILLRLSSATAAPRSPWFGTVNHEHCCGRRRIVARAVTGTECPALTAVTTFPRGGVAFGRLPCCSHLQSSSRWGFSSRNIGFRCIPTPPWLLRLPRHKPSGLALTVRPNDANDLDLDPIQLRSLVGHAAERVRDCRPACRQKGEDFCG